VDEIAFTGGVVWEHADFATHLEIAPGTAGADNIYGGPGDDTLSGGGGGDTVSGGEGNDSLVWSRGDGNDVLSDEGWNEGDRLVLHGVLPGEVTFGVQDGNVVLVIAPSSAGAGDGGALTLIDSTQDFSWTGIDEVVFDNAVVWGEPELQAGVLAASQTAGADTIQGFMASETIVGGAGDDAINGGLGDDVFRWSAGDGNDTLTEGQDCGDDRLELVDVSPGGLTVTQDGDDILLVIGSATLRLVNQALWDDGYGIETFVLDGQTWSAEDLMDQLAGA
jgi:Ca2+-binding RTX toxin-like protein